MLNFYHSDHSLDKIVKLLGEGTFGKVLECVDQDSRSNVAVKVIKNIQKVLEHAFAAPSPLVFILPSFPLFSTAMLPCARSTFFGP